MDIASFALGLGVGLALETVIGVFVTAPIAIWWMKRKLPNMIDDLIENKELMNKFRQYVIGGMFGNAKMPKLTVESGLGLLAQLALSKFAPNLVATSEKKEQ